MFGDDAIGAQVRLFQKRLEEAAIFLLKYLGSLRVHRALSGAQAGAATNSLLLGIPKDAAVKIC